MSFVGCAWKQKQPTLHKQHTHRSKNMTKNPYEIRFDLLNFAQNQLSQEYYSKMEKIRMQKEYNMPMDTIPVYPTKSDIVNLAEELKQFIDNR